MKNIECTSIISIFVDKYIIWATLLVLLCLALIAIVLQLLRSTEKRLEDNRYKTMDKQLLKALRKLHLYGILIIPNLIITLILCLAVLLAFPNYCDKTSIIVQVPIVLHLQNL